MANYYRPRLVFIHATAVKRKMKVKTEGGDVVAEAGDYVVVFPNEARTVLKKAFFESMYESAEETVFCDVCIDFDGVLHSYLSGWQGAAIITDPPVAGALAALRGYLAADMPLSLAVYSARSAQPDGRIAMRAWIERHDAEERRPDQAPLVDQLVFPVYKPAAKVYLDDRGLRFEGTFPSVDELIANFGVWNDAEKHRLFVPNALGTGMPKSGMARGLSGPRVKLEDDEK